MTFIDGYVIIYVTLCDISGVFDVEKNTFLVVDDYEFNRFMLCDAFVDRPIIQAENGFRAIEEYEKHKDEICAVLTDLIMPVLDGFGLLDYFQKNGYSKEIPVFVISSDSSQKSLTRAYELGAEDVINKPYNMLFLKKRVENVLELYRLRKELAERDEK